MHRGYVKVWRKLEESGLLQMPNTLALFMFLLMNATHKPLKVGTKTGVINLERGQYVGGRIKLSEILKQGEQQIRTGLQRLSDMEIITISVTSKYSIYTIENYNIYQDDNQQVTSCAPTDNQQITTKQTHKNIKPNNYSPEFQKFWDAYPKTDRKGGRPPAYKVWVKLGLDSKVDEVIAHVLATVCNREERWIGAPDSYLNKQGWDGWESHGNHASQFEGVM